MCQHLSSKSPLPIFKMTIEFSGVRDYFVQCETTIEALEFAERAFDAEFAGCQIQTMTASLPATGAPESS